MSEMRENFSEYFSERDMFLMYEAMNAGHYYKSLGDWLSEIIADGGYIVAQHLSHDANKKQAAHSVGATKKAQGNLILAGDITDAFGMEVPKAMVIQFGDDESLRAAVDAGQCRFTVFGGEV